METNDLTEKIIGAAHKVLFALKPGPDENHLAQMLGYLNITGLKPALLLNFKNASLGIKRVSN